MGQSASLNRCSSWRGLHLFATNSGLFSHLLSHTGRRNLLNFRNNILRQGTEAEWFLNNQPKDFKDYEKAVIDLMKE